MPPSDNAKTANGGADEKQVTLNRSKAHQARKEAGQNGGEDEEKATSQKTDYDRAQNCTEHWEDPEHLERNMQEFKKFREQDGKSPQEEVSDDKAKKRGNEAKSSSPSKKHKSGSGKHDEPTGTAGSITRVPQNGQQVQWKALPGYVDGEVVEVVYEEKEVDGHKVQASKEDPRVVLKSSSSGKICVHKPDAVYFD